MFRISVECNYCAYTEMLNTIDEDPITRVYRLSHRKVKPWRFMPNNAAVCYDCITSKHAKHLKQTIL